MRFPAPLVPPHRRSFAVVAMVCASVSRRRAGGRRSTCAGHRATVGRRGEHAAHRRHQARDDRGRLRQVAHDPRRRDLRRRHLGIVRLPAAAGGRHALPEEPDDAGRVDAAACLAAAILRRLEMGGVLRRRAAARQRARDRDAAERPVADGVEKSRKRGPGVVGQHRVVRVLERLGSTDDTEGTRRRRARRRRAAGEVRRRRRAGWRPRWTWRRRTRPRRRHGSHPAPPARRRR